MKRITIFWFPFRPLPISFFCFFFFWYCRLVWPPFVAAAIFESFRVSQFAVPLTSMYVYFIGNPYHYNNNSLSAICHKSNKSLRFTTNRKCSYSYFIFISPHQHYIRLVVMRTHIHYTITSTFIANTKHFEIIVDLDLASRFASNFISIFI